MNRIFKAAALMLVLAVAAGPVAADEHAAADKPSISASRSMTLGATVKAIDHETREVTLEGVEGEIVSFTASPDVRNLAQVEVGDQVLAQLYEDVTISVHANPEGAEPGMGELVAKGRAELGDMPGGVMSDTLVITAVVEAIDLENNTFKLRGPKGNIKEFTARDPENLKRAEVGDLVVITITQSVGIIVERPPAG